VRGGSTHTTGRDLHRVEKLPTTETTAAIPETTRRPRRRTAVTAAAVVLLAAVGAYWLLTGRGPAEGGPLENPEVTEVSFSQHPGDTIGYGVPVAWNVGDEPVVIDQVRLIDATPGIDVVEIHAAGPKREALSLSNSEGWPSKDFTDLHPVAGYTVQPRSTPEGDRGVEFVFALRFPELGGYEHGGVEVQYTADGNEYVMQIKTSLRVCVIAASEPLGGDCPLPGEA
jgi:hypothetical protein